jgi:hypothetical protein
MTTFRVMRLHIAVALALMAEPEHGKIAALGQIGSGNNLDTGPAPITLCGRGIRATSPSGSAAVVTSRS